MSLFTFSQSSSYGMPISQRSYEDMAVNRVKGTTQSALESARRQALRMGVNPNSGRYLSAENDAQYDSAAQIAAAGTQASWDWLRNAQQQRQFDAQMALDWDRWNWAKNNSGGLIRLGGKNKNNSNNNGLVRAGSENGNNSVPDELKINYNGLHTNSRGKDVGFGLWGIGGDTENRVYAITDDYANSVLNKYRKIMR